MAGTERGYNEVTNTQLREYHGRIETHGRDLEVIEYGGSRMGCKGRRIGCMGAPAGEGSRQFSDLEAVVQVWEASEGRKQISGGTRLGVRGGRADRKGGLPVVEKG